MKNEDFTTDKQLYFGKKRYTPSPVSSEQKTNQYKYVFNDTESYSPKKYDYSNILFKETTNLNKKDTNFLKQTPFKGPLSEECKFSVLNLKI